MAGMIFAKFSTIASLVVVIGNRYSDDRTVKKQIRRFAALKSLSRLAYREHPYGMRSIRFFSSQLTDTHKARTVAMWQSFE